jgi:hypothetical protein
MRDQWEPAQEMIEASDPGFYILVSKAKLRDSHDLKDPG